MIDLPINKALVAVEVSGTRYCKFCELDQCISGTFACDSDNREDKKNVVFKLVDLPERRENA